MRSISVPVLLLTGPTGVGKSPVLGAASSLLSEAGVLHASVTLSDIGRLYPAPGDDEFNERIAHRNLRSLWSNYAREGAQRLLLERVLETRTLLQRISTAVPGADITVVRLRAPLPLLRDRITARQAGDPAWYLEAAKYLTPFSRPPVSKISLLTTLIGRYATWLRMCCGWRAGAANTRQTLERLRRY